MLFCLWRVLRNNIFNITWWEIISLWFLFNFKGLSFFLFDCCIHIRWTFSFIKGMLVHNFRRNRIFIHLKIVWKFCILVLLLFFLFIWLVVWWFVFLICFLFFSNLLIENIFMKSTFRIFISKLRTWLFIWLLILKVELSLFKIFLKIRRCRNCNYSSFFIWANKWTAFGLWFWKWFLMRNFSRKGSKENSLRRRINMFII